MESEFAANKVMVCVTLCAGHHSGMQDISKVSLAHYDVINEVPVFGLRMHLGCFQSVLSLEYGVCDASCCSVQNSSSKRPLSLQLPTPCLPSAPFQASESLPTLALK